MKAINIYRYIWQGGVVVGYIWFLDSIQAQYLQGFQGLVSLWFSLSDCLDILIFLTVGQFFVPCGLLYPTPVTLPQAFPSPSRRHKNRHAPFPEFPIRHLRVYGTVRSTVPKDPKPQSEFLPLYTSEPRLPFTGNYGNKSDFALIFLATFLHWNFNGCGVFLKIGVDKGFRSMLPCSCQRKQDKQKQSHWQSMQDLLESYCLRDWLKYQDST